MRCVIYTFGISDIPQKFTQATADVTIALDGACEFLQKQQLTPDIILGDFDSISNHDYWGIDLANPSEHHGSNNIKIIPALNQNHTDLDKALKYCSQEQYTQIDIVTATSGRLDHTLHNIRLLRHHYQESRRIILHTATEQCEFIKDQTITLNAEPNQNLAIMAFPKASFSSTGLAFNGDGYLLEFAESESVANKFIANTADITINGEAIIIYPATAELLSAKLKLPNKISQ